MKLSEFLFAGLALSVLLANAPLRAHPRGPRAGSAAPDLATELLTLPVELEGDHEFWNNVRYFIQPEREPQRRPQADASLYTLAEYWHLQFAQDPDRLAPALRARLLDACEAYPHYAADLAHLVPRTPEATKRLLALLDRVPDEGDPSARQQIIRHLSQTSDLFRPQLIAHGKEAHEGPGFMENESDVRALARLDWNQAEPLLTDLAQPDKPRLSALSLALQYQHAAVSANPKADDLRRRLRAIATDSSSPAKARDLAVEGLMATQWPGRDDWYLSLLADGSFVSSSDGNTSYSTLEEPARNEPEVWIPRIAPLVGSSNPHLRQNAVRILVSFQQEESRPDAAVPLLPWLFDPKWVEAESSSWTRHNLIYSLSLMKVPESFPGLLHVLQHPEEDDIFETEYAADAISQYHDPRAIPVLRALLSHDIAKHERLAVAKALLASGDVSQEEKVRAVTALARQVATRAGREQLYQMELDDEVKGIGGEVILGLAVISTQGAQARLIEVVRERSRQLRASDPEVTDSLDAILAILPDTERDAQLIAAIRDGRARAPAVRDAIRRRAWLCKTETAALSALAEGKGAPAAVAAALLGSSERELEILAGEDRVAQRTLLLLLRFSVDMVPDDVVLKLVDSKDPALARAAQAYWELLCRWHHSL